MPIRPVVELTVAHPFLAAGALPGDALAPDAASARVLRGLRLVAKPVGAKLTLFGEFDGEGRAKIGLVGPVSLGFELSSPGGSLAMATDVAALGDAALFTDAGAAAGDPQPLKLVQGERRHPPGRLAAVAIQLTADQLAAAGTGAPRRCLAALPAVAARWCYHLVTNLPNPLAEWRIARAGGANGGPAVAFGDAGRAELAAPAPDDAIGEALRRRDPTMRVLRFVSDAPVAASEAARRGYQLFAGDTRLFGSLPNPSPRRAARVGGEPVFDEVIRLIVA